MVEDTYCFKFPFIDVILSREFVDHSEGQVNVGYFIRDFPYYPITRVAKTSCRIWSKIGPSH